MIGNVVAALAAHSFRFRYIFPHRVCLRLLLILNLFGVYPPYPEECTLVITRRRRQLVAVGGEDLGACYV